MSSLHPAPSSPASKSAAQPTTSIPPSNPSSISAIAPITPPDVFKRDPVVSLVVTTIMRHGRKSLAERLVSDSLRLIAARTNQDPVQFLTRAVDSVAPLVRLKTSTRGATRTSIPWPLHERARRRTAILWIKEAADRKKGGFPARFANEVVAVIGGTSSALEKKANVHRAALQARSNVILKPRVWKN
ncbi:hypothetical protein HDU93_001535 [Gonapodya sp. JEL0774]|nr:hypothetical protein HDU93_001535 [Gonapodya sp. JEL0774]